MDDIQKDEDFEKWVEFRKGCPKRKGHICWSRDLFRCDENTKNGCDLWYAVKFVKGND